MCLCVCHIGHCVSVCVSYRPLCVHVCVSSRPLCVHVCVCHLGHCVYMSVCVCGIKITKAWNIIIASVHVCMYGSRLLTRPMSMYCISFVHTHF